MESSGTPSLPWQILRPLQVALPLREDFWPTLAAGFRRPVEQISAHLADWQASGVIAGCQGEWNPAYPGSREWLVRLRDSAGSANPEQVLRWVGVAPDGSRVASWMDHGQSGAIPLEAARMTIFRRCLWFVDGGGAKILDPEDDRTGRVYEGDLAPALKADGRTSLVAHFFSQPVAIVRGVSPWEVAGEALGISPAEVLKGVRDLLNARVWRRFAVRVSPKTAGFRGCGLAGWRLEPGDLEGASNALARCHGVGDVVVREPSTAWSANLYGVFLGQGAGSGQAAAEHAARQWGRPLASWLDLEID